MISQKRDVITGFRNRENSYEICLDTSIQSVVNPLCRVPVVIHHILKEKLDEMVADSVITPVTDATDWGGPSIAVVRNPSGALRIGIDPNDLNRGMKREHYPQPTVIGPPTEAKCTAPDASNLFWWVPYRWFRMSFGFISAPEVWQRHKRNY